MPKKGKNPPRQGEKQGVHPLIEKSLAIFAAFRWFSSNLTSIFHQISQNKDDS